jgi:hypothetical protein
LLALHNLRILVAKAFSSLRGSKCWVLHSSSFQHVAMLLCVCVLKQRRLIYAFVKDDLQIQSQMHCEVIHLQFQSWVLVKLTFLVICVSSLSVSNS